MQSKVIFLILLTSANFILAREEWVDPHDMNIRIKPVRKEEHSNPNEELFNSCDCVGNLYRDKTSPHLRKLIRLITDMTYYDRRSDVYKGVIEIHMNVTDYEFLKKYISTELNADHVLKQLSGIIEKSLESSFYNTYFFSIGEYIYLIIQNENVLLTLGLSIVSYILWRIQPHNYKLTTLFKLFLPLVYLSDFVLRYRAKLEEVEVDQLLEYESYKGCDPDRLGWFDWIYDKFTGYCQNSKRQFLLSQRAATHIFTPLHVISDQFVVFVTIFKHLGAGFGNFMWALIENVPWYIKPFLGIFSFLLITLILLMFGSYIFGISPKMNLFHMIQFEFLHKDSGGHNRNLTSQDHISGENLRTLLSLQNKNTPVLVTSMKSIPKKNSAPSFKTKVKPICKKKINSAIVSSNSSNKTNVIESD